MRFVSIRDVRNTPSEVWEALDHEDLVLTANGRPKAVIVKVDGDDFESTLALLRRVRAQAAVASLRKKAAAEGKDRLGTEDIDAEIRATRKRARR